MSKEADEDRLERHRIEGAVNFIGGIIKGAKDRDGDDGLLLCAENAEKAIRCLRVDKATLRARVAELEAALRASGEEHKTSEAQFSVADPSTDFFHAVMAWNRRPDTEAAVERVARAISATALCGTLEPDSLVADGDNKIVLWWTLFITTARAAIAAMEG
jgi:hypothetical protein